MKNLRKPHKEFSLNGKKIEGIEDLLRYAKTISEETFSFLNTWFDNSDCIEVQTSGSTGTPKKIQLKKEFMINSALATGIYFNVLEKTKALLCLSSDHIAGKMMLVRALVLGWQLDIVAPSSNPLMLTKNSYDFCAMVPLQLRNSLSELHRIKKLIVGGGVVSDALIAKLKEVSTEVYATYGMTETITHIAVKQLNNLSLREGSTLQSYHKQITSVVKRPCNDGTEKPYYKTLPNINISKDKRGCLVIDAPKISDKQIITNDIVELISETQFRWLGRYDSIINSGGVKLIPEQIEKKLSVVIDHRFFVAGIPDEKLGEKLILIIENENYILNERYVQNLNFQLSTLNSLDKYEIPKKIYLLRKFIETDTKKIQRHKTLDLIL